MASPLHYLTRKDVEFAWTEECQVAFEALKEKLVQASVLAYSDLDGHNAAFEYLFWFQKMWGVPFDPTAIDCVGRAPEQTRCDSTESAMENMDLCGNPEDGSSGDEQVPTDDIISPEQECRFQTRYEEGWDLYDPEYARWLEVNHPTCVRASSVLDHFSSIEPETPLEAAPRLSTSSGLSSSETGERTQSTYVVWPILVCNWGTKSVRVIRSVPVGNSATESVWVVWLVPVWNSATESVWVVWPVPVWKWRGESVCVI